MKRKAKFFSVNGRVKVYRVVVRQAVQQVFRVGAKNSVDAADKAEAEFSGSKINMDWDAPWKFRQLICPVIDGTCETVGIAMDADQKTKPDI